MLKGKLSALLILSLVLCSMVSCEPEEATELPPVTAMGAQTIGFKLNGTTISLKKSTMYSQLLVRGNNLEAIAISGDASGRIGFFELGIDRRLLSGNWIGTHPIRLYPDPEEPIVRDALQLTSFGGLGCDDSYSSMTDFTNEDWCEGWFRVDFFQTDPIPIVAGAFELHLYSEDCNSDTVHITEGRFDVILDINVQINNP